MSNNRLNEFNTFDLDSRLNDSISLIGSIDFKKSDFPSPLRSFKEEERILQQFIEENRNLKEINKKLYEDNINLKENLKNKEEKLFNLNQENIKILSQHERFSETKFKLSTYENILNNPEYHGQQQQILFFTEKIQNLELNYQREIIDLKNTINSLKSQLNNVNNISLESIRIERENNILSFTSPVKDYRDKSNLNDEIKSKFTELRGINEKLKSELENEKIKYISLLQMNQDLGKKIIENIKILAENKSEIIFLKNKISNTGKDSQFLEDDETETTSIQEDKKKSYEIKLNLEKINNENKKNILELTQKIKDYEFQIENLNKQLNLEKMENDNLQEIKKMENPNFFLIKNLENQIKQNEEYINELKFNLQNSEKTNLEQNKNKSNLESEIITLKNKVKEQDAYLLLSNDRDPRKSDNSIFSSMRDDKSNIFSKISANNLNQSKFFDNKIKDLEESLIMEKDNYDNIIKIKQNLIEKLKKNNENLTEERNQLHKELSEEKMKLHSLTIERNTFLDKEYFCNGQIQDLNAEICDLKISLDLYEQLQDKLGEYEKQFEIMSNNLNSNQHMNVNIQQLINDNLELGNMRNKVYGLENELGNKEQEISGLKEKLFYLEKELESKIVLINKFDENLQNEIKKKTEESEKIVKDLEQENSDIKKAIDDNKIIIYNLREKCKDVIDKEKEILKLNNLIVELKEKKKKRVTFGREILVEFQKDGIPSNPTVLTSNGHSGFDTDKLNIILQDQRSLYEKYTNDLLNLKKTFPNENNNNANIEEGKTNENNLSVESPQLISNNSDSVHGNNVSTSDYLTKVSNLGSLNINSSGSENNNVKNNKTPEGNNNGMNYSNYSLQLNDLIKKYNLNMNDMTDNSINVKKAADLILSKNPNANITNNISLNSPNGNIPNNSLNVSNNEISSKNNENTNCNLNSPISDGNNSNYNNIIQNNPTNLSNNSNLILNPMNLTVQEYEKNPLSNSIGSLPSYSSILPNIQANNLYSSLNFPMHSPTDLNFSTKPFDIGNLNNDNSIKNSYNYNQIGSVDLNIDNIRSSSINLNNSYNNNKDNFNNGISKDMNNNMVSSIILINQNELSSKTIEKESNQYNDDKSKQN